MTVEANAQFDHYTILAPLGKGGMGEVYRARDTRLNREVALKVLPETFAQDADRLRRFEQEALATSALNHPNILTVHDFGLHAGNPYLVMELLEGEELRAQLRGGALPISTALDYAEQIAAGLAIAHGSRWPITRWLNRRQHNQGGRLAGAKGCRDVKSKERGDNENRRMLVERPVCREAGAEASGFS